MGPEERLRKLYEEFEENSAKYKRRYTYTRGSLLALGVVAVFIQGIQYVAEDLWLDRFAVSGTNITGVHATALLAAACTSLATFITAASSRENASRRWIAYRAGAEALKSEAFLRAGRSGRYAGPDPDSVLEERLLEIEDLVDDIRASDQTAGAA